MELNKRWTKSIGEYKALDMSILYYGFDLRLVDNFRLDEDGLSIMFNLCKIVSWTFHWRRKCHHPGILLSFTLLGLEFEMEFYDKRHY